MKKYLYCGCFVLSLILFTGCSNKTLYCSKESTGNPEMKMFQDVNVKFKNDAVSKLTTNINVDLGDGYTDLSDSLMSSIESQYADYKDEKGVNYSFKKNDNGFKFKLDINYDKLPTEIKKDLSIVNYENSYEAAKKDFEKNGYNCK